MKISTQTIRDKKGKEPVVCCSVYDTLTARLAAEAGVDLLLVGDSMGNVILGFENTLPVTLEMMLHHTAAVSRAKTDALVVADLPFGWAHRSEDALMQACMRLMQEAGAGAVKVEGGAEMAGRIRMLTRAGIPVFGHIGLKPQELLQIGGYKKVGKDEASRQQLLEDARAIEEAGVFAMVAELLDADSAKALQEATRTPIIGIGSGKNCDGQILVANDLLGLTLGKVPSFVKQYASLREEMSKAFQAYAAEVRQGRFPA